ncbi:MAG: DJ-1/PfpI family protein, partial [Gammaproteobacteria bacterium]|nr:DJ-1/PfpI family protein [Gammaproteobacteria bacterium]
IGWLQTQISQVEFLCSVCTGSMVLAKAGLLSNCHVTTHHDNLADLRKLVSQDTTVVANKRYLDNGKILTAGGISAGIDMSLYLVNKLYGAEVLKKTLAEMEYHWTPEVDLHWKDTC